ncbi:hypothetical protein [Shimazuella alba]|uniref:Uncharacterized protein n=1 Tax=Shimazuella alba TaxID=2690964 RepID=A0A6I4W3S0_9BACL|nr:hypothetical protein [Shimazuella alba]MXQ55424.1 hypothetical protein [Shimazuella alba]
MSDNLLEQLENGAKNKRKDIPFILDLVKKYKAEEKERGSGPNLTRSETKGQIDGFVASVAYLATIYQNLHDTYMANHRTHEIAVVQLREEVKSNSDIRNTAGRVELKHKCGELGAQSEALVFAQRVLSTSYKDLDFVIDQINRVLPRNHQPNPVSRVKLKRPPFASRTPKPPSLGAQITKQMTAAAISRYFKKS